MRKIIGFAFLIVFLLSFPSIGQAAESNTHIYLDGQEMNLSNSRQVQVVNESIMIPLRVVMEELGYNVAWEQKTSTVTIKQSDTVISLVLNQKTATVNGQVVGLQAASFAKEGTTFVPLRFVGEQAGLTVNWDSQTKSVNLISPDQGQGSGSGSNTGSGNVGSAPDTGNEQVIPDAQINGISFSNNYLMIASDSNVTPSIFSLDNPNRIVIDLPNTSFSDTFLTENLDANQSGKLTVTGYPDVSQVRYSLYSSKPSTIRIVIDLNYAKGYTLINNNDGILIVDLNQEGDTPVTPPVTDTNPKPGSTGKKIVVLDAGHGYQDPGAISVNGRKEKDFNLAVALKVDKLMKNDASINLVLTRNDDSFLELKERVKIANDLKADIFISIHANSGASTANGTETYYKKDDSVKLANVVHKNMLAATGLKNRQVRFGNFHVIRETNMPAVLIEAGFLSNTSDEAVLFNSAAQDRMAAAIVASMKEYLGVK